MSLFGSIFKGILKAVPIIGSAISANDSKKAVGQANNATQLGITNAKGDLNSQLAASQTRLDPYETAGTDALTGIRALTGLNGNDAQASAIAQQKSSPLFDALFGTGQDAALANGSAIGGLRGGNIRDALFKNGRDTLAQVIQQHLADLGGISNAGLGATEFGANLGANNASGLAQLDTGSGQANAGAILGKQNIDNTLYSGLRSVVSNAVTAGGGVGAIGPGGAPFDFTKAFNSLLGDSGKSSATALSPLSALSGGGQNNSNPTGYHF